MTKKDDAQKSITAKKRTRSAPSAQKSDGAQEANDGLTGKQVLALWELILKGDGKTATQRSVKLDQSEVKGLESARLVTVESGPRKKDPVYGSKLHVTDEGWGWANQKGFAASLPPSRAAVPVLQALLVKVGDYLKTHDLALDDLLRPRRADPEPGEAAAPVALEERIRSAYLHVTGGALNQYVRLALLRAQLGDVAVEAIDAELGAMQQRGGAVLYPIDDPQRLRPEDDAAALRVSGERRDLFSIKG